MGKIIRVNKDDEIKLSRSINDLQLVLKCAKEYDYNIFNNDTVSSFKSVIRLCKAANEDINSGKGVDISRPNINSHYLKAMKSIKKWCNKYKMEVNRVIVNTKVQVVLRSIVTGEGFTITVGA